MNFQKMVNKIINKKTVNKSVSGFSKNKIFEAPKNRLHKGNPNL